MPVIKSIKLTPQNRHNGYLFRGISGVKIDVEFDAEALGERDVYTVTLKMGNVAIYQHNYLVGNRQPFSYVINTDKYADELFPTVIVEVMYRKVLAFLNPKKEEGSATLGEMVYQYVKPSISSCVCFRSNSNGEHDDKGKFITAQIRASVFTSPQMPVNSIRDMAIVVTPRNSTDKSEHLEFGTLMNVTFGGAYDSEKGYELRVIVNDMRRQGDYYTDYVTTGLVALEMHYNSAAAFGKKVEHLDGLELGESWKLYTHDDVYHDKNIHVGKDVYVGGEVIEENKAFYQLNVDSDNLFCIFLQRGSFAVVSFSVVVIGSNQKLHYETIAISRVGSKHIAILDTNNHHGGCCRYDSAENACYVYTSFVSNNENKVYYKIDSFTKCGVGSIGYYGTKTGGVI